MTEEIRIKNATTGGEKGQKIQRFDLIPPEPMAKVARHYGLGAKKYADRNWEKGYDWSLSLGALERHLNAIKRGEDIDIDPDTGSESWHAAAIVFHALALLEFLETHPELDDRPATVRAREAVRKEAAAKEVDRLQEAVNRIHLTPDGIFADRDIVDSLRRMTKTVQFPYIGLNAMALLTGIPVVELPEPKKPRYQSGERVSVRSILKAVDGVQLRNGFGDPIAKLTGYSVDGVTAILDALEDAGFQVTQQ